MNTYRSVFKGDLRMRQSPKQPARVRRAQLIKAAQKVFTRKGYAGATTAEIARKARLTKGALYFHFKNKEDIFFAVVRALTEEAVNPIHELTRIESDLDRFVEKLIYQGFSLIYEDKYISVGFWQPAHKIPRIRRYMAREHEKVEEAVAAYVSRKSDLKPRECRALIKLLHAFLDGIMIRQSFGCRDYNLNSMARTLIDATKLYLKKNEIKLD
jgi:AcrR family transcriptional regulator